MTLPKCSWGTRIFAKTIGSRVSKIFVIAGKRDGLSTLITSLLLRTTSYTTVGAVVINDRLYSLSSLS